MLTARDLRSKRAVAGISGQAVCEVAGISRAKLSDIEREYIVATPDELQRIGDAIDQILRTREDLTKLAVEAGMSLAGVRI